MQIIRKKKWFLNISPVNRNDILVRIDVAFIWKLNINYIFLPIRVEFPFTGFALVTIVVITKGV